LRGCIVIAAFVTVCVQVLKLITSAHVLACAPSNAAADLLAERLLDHLPSSSSLLRLCARSRDWVSVPPAIKVSQYLTLPGRLVQVYHHCNTNSYLSVCRAVLGARISILVDVVLD